MYNCYILIDLDRMTSMANKIEEKLYRFKNHNLNVYVTEIF